MYASYRFENIVFADRTLCNLPIYVITIALIPGLQTPFLLVGLYLLLELFHIFHEVSVANVFPLTRHAQCSCVQLNIATSLQSQINKMRILFYCITIK